MRQIREIMASKASAQDRLNGFVRVIAGNLIADVCSVYLRRDGGELELYATIGLAQDSVHVTQLGDKEGLVGEVARTAQPLNVPDARDHPAFSYQPQTQEDDLATFLGVPMLRGGRLLGVLTVQNKVRRAYDEEEVEALQTAAMVLAEVMVDLADADAGQLTGIAVRPSSTVHRTGQGFAEGLSIGLVVKHEPHVSAAMLIADDPDDEVDRLERGMGRLRAGIDAILAGRGAVLSAQPREVLEAYRMIAHDRGWLDRLTEAARSGLTAEAAVERVRNEQRARMVGSKDAYLRERLNDLEDLANRLLSHLAEDHGQSDQTQALPDNAILVARTISPAALLEIDAERLRGVVLEEGAAASHAVIVAKALGVPVVGLLEGVLDQVEPGDTVIVDGARGEVFLRPAEDTLEVFSSRIQRSGERAAAFEAQRDEPACTLDGERIHLLLNAGLRVDLGQLHRTGADGIGLFRTEFQFMISDTMPRLAAQTALYRAALEAVGPDNPCIFRTLDLGGDKILPYADIGREENPAMGWRAVRIGLDRPGLMRYQLRALLAASAGRRLSVIFPLVTTVGEFEGARELVEQELAKAQARGKPAPTSIDVGAMVETPAMVYQLGALLDVADFVCVGANDLLQFFFASDRGNPRVSDRYDVLSPPALRLFGDIAAACAQAKAPVTVCGEIAGRPLEAMALIGLGFRRLSMPPSGIGPVKRMVLGLDSSRARETVSAVLHSNAPSVREELTDAATRLQIAL